VSTFEARTTPTRSTDAVIETPRLLLREMKLEDLDFVAAMLADPEVMRFYPKTYSRAEAEAWIRRQLDRYRRDGHGLWLAVDRRTGEPLGQVGLVRQQIDGRAEPEVGYLIHRPFWRQGLATEAAAATRDYAFAKLDKQRVISLIRPENVPSQGVARKLGMSVEKTVVHWGLDHWVFARSRDARAASVRGPD
jgi:[ribosomal protein S5]-alanine N-acetyltransferase